MPATICDILPSACALLGVPDAADGLGLADRFGDVRRVAVVLIDGMGLHLLPRLAPHAPLLASTLTGATGRLAELSCTFPSTTPTSLVSLGTGALPGEHGILGFTLNVPGTDRVLTHIFWRDDPPPRMWQPVPTWFERCSASGVPATAVLPAVFIGSGLTEAAYGGARFRGVAKGEDYASALVAEIRSGAGLVYGYTAALDTAAHRFGIASPQWSEAATAVDTLLSQVLEALPSDAALLVTADHGGLDVAADARFDIGTNAALAAGIRVVAGEPRVRYLHTLAGATPDVVATWQAVLGTQADVLVRDEAMARGLFGPVRDEHRARIGDVVVICHADCAVLASDREPPQLTELIGFHGGLNPVETAIPLISVRG